MRPSTASCAEKVTVISRRFGSDEAWKWESEGADGYTMEPCERAAAGSDVILTLKADTDEDKYSDYLSEYRLRSLVRKYSDYIRYPIRMEVSSHSRAAGISVPDIAVRGKTGRRGAVHAAVRADHKRSLRAQRIEMPPAAAGHRAKNQGCLCSQSRISFAAS